MSFFLAVFGTAEVVEGWRLELRARQPFIAREVQLLQSSECAECLRNRALELVVGHVEALERGHALDARGQLPGDLVVSRLEVLEELKLADVLRDLAC